ncbi:MAG: toll/interleukin-1 receptor domain-containing protein [Saprospiraceae bacterium]|nr:toll/interleukin-1 receptor domain-containing protein [Saprospiraceae bacterium]HRD81748.1 toll/interleukin-1 receptor domain-containing protein [Saprospiraceae bacterium]
MNGLELEWQGLNETLRITIEKKNLLQKELALAFDPNMKFMLEKQVQQLETDIAGLREKMAKLEAQRPPAASTPAAPGTPTPTPAASGKKIFFSYSKHDRQYLDELLRQLSGLRRQGKIQPWNDLDILPGEEWDAKIKHELQTADIIMLFLSPDFLNTDYIWDVEITAAMARHEQGTAVVIPVAVRPCDWSGLPFSKLNALPSKAKPVTSYTNRDEAWLEVVQGVKRVV